MNQSTFQLILLLAFLGIVFLAVIAGLIGLIKGIYKTSVKTLVKLIFTVILLFTSPSISSWIGNIDISGLVKSENPITLFSYLVNWLYNTGYISPINGLSIYETAIAIATSALAFVTFFIGMVLVQIFISLITAIIYHGIFRWFLPVETKAERKARKKAKKDKERKNENILTSGLTDTDGKATKETKKKLPLLRVPGGLLGLAQEFVFVCVMVSPLTALARIAVTNKNTVNEGMKASGMSQDQIDMVSMMMDTTEDSLLYKVLGFHDFDSKIMNRASSVTLNDTSVSFSGLVSSAFDIADPLLKDGTISYDKAAGQVTINFSSLLSTSTIDSLVTTLMGSPMVLALIPPLLDVGLNSINGFSFATDDLNFSDIDWSSELDIIRSIYNKVYSLAIEPMVMGDKVDFKSFCIKTSSMSENDDDWKAYMEAVSELGKMDTIRKNLPVLLSGIGTYLENQGFSILPTDQNAYKDIDWSEDLKTFVSSVLNYFRVIGLDINADLNVNFLKDKTFEALKDDTKRSSIQDIICGYTNRKGLLDTQLFSTLSLGKIVSSTLSSIPALSKYVSSLDFSFLDSFSKAELKNEFSTMFEIAGTVFDENSKINIDNMSSIDLSDHETASQLADLLSESKESQIFTRLYPSVMKGILFHSNIDFSSVLYGLTPYNFNYSSTSFIDSLENILRLLPDIQALQQNLSSSKTTAEKLEGINTATLRQLLDLIVNSNFFNADQRTGINSETQKNVNIYTFFENLFSTEPFSQMGLVAPTLDQMQTMGWNDTTSSQGEISKLVKLVDLSKENASFFTSMNLSDINDTTSLSELLKTGLDSDLLSPSVLSIIDRSLSEYLEDIGIPYSFNEMRNALWKEDADDIGELLKILKEIDFDNFDLTSLEPEKLNALLTVLSHMNLIQTGNNSSDPFGYALYSVLEKQNFFSDLGVEEDPSLFLLENSSWSSKTETDSSGLTITTEGEIYSFVSFYSAMKEVGFDTLKNGKIPEGFIDSISESMQSSILRKLFVSGLRNTLEQIAMPDGYESVLSSIDLNILLTMDHDRFVNELKIFEQLYRLSDDKIGSDSKLDLMLDNFYTLSTIKNEDGTTLEDDMVDLINALTGSKLFTTLKTGERLSPVSYILENTVKTLGLTEKVTMVKNPSLSEEALVGILRSVTDWKAEGNSFLRVIHSLQGMDDSSFSLVGGKMTEERASELLTSMNQSTLFHRMIPSLFESAFEEKDLSSYLKNPETGKVDHPFVFRIHLSDSEEDISYWQNEIDYGVPLLLGEGGFRSFFESDSGTISDIDFSDINAKALYYIGRMNLFKENRSYLLYNLIDSYSTENFSANSLFLVGEDVPYGYQKNVYRFENLFFRNPKLLDDQGELDKKKAFRDLELLNHVIHTALEKAPDAVKGSNLKDIDMDFVDLTEHCYEMKDGSFYRSDFASELLAGIETLMIQNPNYQTYFANLSSFDFYQNDYRFINSIEARAFKGFVALTNTERSKFGGTIPYYTKTSLTSVFSYFGEQDEEKVTEYKETFSYFSAFEEYQTTGNSLIALAEKAVITSLPALSEDGLSVNTLSSFATVSLDDYSFAKYLSSAKIS